MSVKIEYYNVNQTLYITKISGVKTVEEIHDELGIKKLIYFDENMPHFYKNENKIIIKDGAVSITYDTNSTIEKMSSNIFEWTSKVIKEAIERYEIIKNLKTPNIKEIK